jgi:hypothetical protein
MRKMLLHFVAILTLLALTSALAPQALAEATRCRGALGAVTVDDLVVPSGATCTLDGTTIRGNIDVRSGATLDATGVSVRGNIQSDEHAAVGVDGASKVGGSIQLRRGGAFSILDTAVGGDIQVDENRGASSLDANTVGDDVHVIRHRDGVSITDNQIDGNLQCRDNVPAPTGGGNVVEGNADGQCRRL